MDDFLARWGEAALTALGFFWMALWAFVLGYAVSSAIQVFITSERMQRSMGKAGPRSVALATFFGFISSSCSFAALSTTRSLFQKGAGPVPALAFLLASTNLVIELGIVIALFLSWQFVVGEYVGGLLLIAVMWIVLRLTLPRDFVEEVRKRAASAGGEHEGEAPGDWKQRIKTRAAWSRVGRRYRMEWAMVWKDVAVGFTIAGVIAAFVPPEFFRALFVGSGAEGGAAWWQIVLHTFIGPVAAFFTFIGSMGNVPLAAVLFSSGVSFAGVMAFLFSDLVVLPVLRINAQYYGWKTAIYILFVLLVSLVVTSLMLHAGLGALDLLPDGASQSQGQSDPAERFTHVHTWILNIAALVGTGVLVWLAHTSKHDAQGHKHPEQDHENDDHEESEHDHSHHHPGGGGSRVVGAILKWLAIAAFVWLAGGLIAAAMA